MGTVPSQNGTRQYFGVKAEPNCFDDYGDGRVFCLLWGEPGLRWVGGWVGCAGMFFPKCDAVPLQAQG